MKPKAPKTVSVLVITTLTILLWIFFSVYKVLISKPKAVVDVKQLEPLEPSFDSKSLEEIKKRIYFEETPETIISPPEKTTTSTVSASQRQKNISPTPTIATSSASQR